MSVGKAFGRIEVVFQSNDGSGSILERWKRIRRDLIITIIGRSAYSQTVSFIILAGPAKADFI
jgi:hypothetical protein